MNQQIYPLPENIYQNDPRQIPISQPENLHHYNNHQMYDGGDEMEDLERTRNEVQKEFSAYYDYADLLYSIFCCNRGNDKNLSGSRNAKNGQFKNEFEIFDGERDLVNIIRSINNIKSQISILLDRLENIKDIQIVTSQHQRNEDKVNLNCSSDAQYQKSVYLMDKENLKI